MNRIISPSLLSANFSRLVDDIILVEKLGVNRLHLDIMDGHFVPNLTFGPFIINDIRQTVHAHPTLSEIWYKAASQNPKF